MGVVLSLVGRYALEKLCEMPPCGSFEKRPDGLWIPSIWYMFVHMPFWGYLLLCEMMIHFRLAVLIRVVNLYRGPVVTIFVGNLHRTLMRCVCESIVKTPHVK